MVKKSVDIKKLVLILIVVFASCRTKVIENKSEILKPNKNFEACEILKIDSISNYYLIYGLTENYRCKIVSRKQTSKSKNIIKVNNKYDLRLKKIKCDSILNPPMNYLDRKRCSKFFPSVEICTEPGFELYETDDLVGLYYKD